MNTQAIRGIALALALAVAGATYAAEPATRQFEFCRRYADGCGSSGRGYSVCEAYLKHLNAMPFESPGNGCRPWLDPDRHDFKLPNWEVLDVRKHLDWIYEMEQRVWYGTHPPTPGFEAWKHEWLGKLDQQMLHPRLKRSRLVLDATVGEEELVAYDRGDWQGCRDGRLTVNDGNGIYVSGYSLFISRDGGRRFLQVVSGADASRGDVVLFGGKPFWLTYRPNILVPHGPLVFFVNLKPFKHLSDWPKPGQDLYVAPDRCVYDERRSMNSTDSQGGRK